ncbi:MAG: anaerobic ribonucleoside-triphosphate reductase activating protein [Candidatus Muiribacteriota bacterium]
MLRIGGLIKQTLKDFPGNISCVIFLRGCDFRCPFCHNPDLIYREGESIPFNEVVDYIDGVQKWLEGIVISGGEPLLNYDIVNMLKFFKKKFSQKIKIDTNGNHPEMLKELIQKKLIDFVSMDIKNVLEEDKYNKVTGKKVLLRNIIESIGIIKNSSVDYEFRTTVIPELHDAESVKKIKKIAGSNYKIQNFSNKNPFNPEFKKIKPFSETEFKEMVAGLKNLTF